MRQQLNACMYVSAHILCVCARQIQISGYVHIGIAHKRVCAQWKFHERADYVMGLKKILLLLSLASIHFLSYVIKKDKRVSKWNCFFLVHCPTSSIFR